jgi:hypothetical protein
MVGVNQKQLELAYHLLALDGDSASVRKQMGESAFESMINKEAQKIAQQLPKSIVNSKKAYGITETGMSYLKNHNPTNYNALERILSGIHNCDVPHKILRELNSSEILALYLGVGQLKTYNYIPKKDDEIRFVEFMNLEFPEQMSLLVGYGYEYSGIRVIKGRGYSEHPTKPGDLKRRMNEIHPSLFQEFIDSLGKPTVKSDKCDKINSYHDPNIDGPKDGVGRKNYIHRIVTEISHIFERNHVR